MEEKNIKNIKGIVCFKELTKDTEANYLTKKGELVIITDAFGLGEETYPGIKISNADGKPASELEYVRGEREIISCERNAEGNGYTITLTDGTALVLKDGEPGENAGFGTAEVTIDDNVGIPSVEITSEGPDTAKVFKFDFKNLKGRGITSISQTTTATESEGQNIITIKYNDNSEDTTFVIKNGAQGQPGYTPQKGIDYNDGTSVTITNINQNNVSGGVSTVTFSDGKSLFVYNGKDGTDGEGGVDFDLPISKGNIDQSLVFFNQGIASGENSIVNGENSQAISKNTISIGESNIAGIKGYYWDRNNVTFNENGTVKIPLIKDKHPTTVVGNESNIAVTELDWAVGDNISMEMANQYPFCSIIESIEDVTITFDNGLADSDNATGTITTKAIVLNEAPFAEVTLISLSREVYDDYSIWAIQRTYNGTNSSIVVRSGEVEFGQGAQIFGELNFGGGMNAASFGAQNAALGDNGFTCGRDNITGNAGFTCGHNNLNLGFGTFVSGEDNIIKGKKKADGTNEATQGSIIAGTKNLVAIWNGAAFGRCNKANQKNSQFVIGEFNKETVNMPLFLVGNGGWGKSGSGNTEGVATEIIDGGVEAPICRDNAFAVYYNGSATVGSRHILADVTGIFTAGTHNTVRGLNGAAFGKDNVVKGEGCLAIGTGLEVNGPGDAPGVVIGQYNKKEQYRLFVVARGNSDSDRNNDIFTVSGWSGGGRVDVNQPLRITEIHMLKDPTNASLGNAFQINSAGNMTLSGNLAVSGTITAATWTPSEGGY